MYTNKQQPACLRITMILIFVTILGNPMPVQAGTAPLSLAAPPGSLDATFGTGGLVTTAIGPGSAFSNAVAIQPDGKIVVAGGFNNHVYDDFFVFRYTGSGLPDPSFGSSGLVATSFGDDDVAQAIAIQDDGKIVVAGYSSPDGEDASTIVLARYNENGSYDTSFGGDGKVIADLGIGQNQATDIAIQPDGKIIVSGYKYITGNCDVALLRYNSDGSLDMSFDSDGIVITDIGGGNDCGMSVAIQPDGKIIVGGFYSVVRYNNDGSLDMSFDGDGIATTLGIGGYVALQPDGKILVAGYNIHGTLYLERFNENGSLDTTFGTDGQVSAYLGELSSIRGIALQENGKIVLVGYIDSVFLVVRYNDDGTLDTGFDSDGIVITDFGSDQSGRAYAVAIQPDGKIVVAGDRYIVFSNHVVALVRYNGDPVLDPLSPSGTLDGVANPTFEWSTYSRATSYRLAVYSLATSSYVILDTVATSFCNTSQCSYPSPINLTNGDYKFKVLAYYAGGVTPYSDWMEFTITNIPLYPIPISPSGTVTGIMKPDFTWSAYPGATSYYLAVYSNSAAAYLIMDTVATSYCNTTQCTYPSPVNMANGTYKWKVLANLNGGTRTPFSPFTDFSITGVTLPLPPYPPTPISPSSTVTTTHRPTFQWSQVPNAVFYRLGVLHIPTNTYTILLNVYPSCSGGVCSYSHPTIDLVNGNYRFKVLARNASGMTAYSSWMNFSVNCNLPVAPVLVAPSGTTSTDKPTFQWKPVSGATKYRLAVYSLGASSYPILTYVYPSACTSTLCSYTPTTALASDDYKFKMLTYNTYGASGYTDWMSFTVP